MEYDGCLSLVFWARIDPDSLWNIVKLVLYHTELRHCVKDFNLDKAILGKTHMWWPKIPKLKTSIEDYFASAERYDKDERIVRMVVGPSGCTPSMFRYISSLPDSLIFADVKTIHSPKNDLTGAACNCLPQTLKFWILQACKKCLLYGFYDK